MAFSRVLILTIAVFLAGLTAGGVFLTTHDLQMQNTVQELSDRLKQEKVETRKAVATAQSRSDQITKLSQELDRAQKQVEGLQGQLAEATSDLQAAQAALASSQSSLTAEHKVAQLEQKNLDLLNLIHPKGFSPPAAPPSTSKPSAPSLPAPDFASFNSALVVAEGDKKSGSGLIINSKDSPRLVIPLTVLSGNSTLVIHYADGTTFTPQTILLSKDSELLGSIPLTGKPHGVDLLPDIDQNVASGDQVVVLPSLTGTRVGGLIRGRIDSVAPQSISLKSSIDGANLGSPVIHLKSGKILGIAGYSHEIASEDTGEDSSRLLGTDNRLVYRLDGLNNWQPVGWTDFAREGLALAPIQQRTNRMMALLEDIRNTGDVTFEKYEAEDDPLKDLVAELNDHLKQAHMGGDYYRQTKQLFLSYLEDFCEHDLNDLGSPPLTSFHKSILTAQTEVRAAIVKQLKQLSNAQDNTVDFGLVHAAKTGRKSP